MDKTDRTDRADRADKTDRADRAVGADRAVRAGPQGLSSRGTPTEGRGPRDLGPKASRK